MEGIRVLTNKLLTVQGEPTEVRRPLSERWFTRPWRPWVATRMYTPQIPDRHMYRFDDLCPGAEVLVMHPDIYAEIVAAQEKTDAGS